MKNTTISIHQPNYIPWLGFFNKILCSDIFVVYDDVQFPMSDDFANKNKIRTKNGILQLTVPIKDKGDLKKWNEIEILNNGWNKKHLKSIQLNYNKSKYFKEYFPLIQQIYERKYIKLMDLNMDLINLILKILNIDVKIIYSSQLSLQNISGSEKIINILNKLQADYYISGKGEGSKRYINNEIFNQNNITLIWQDYNHHIYEQTYDGFESHLSILDLLFNHGKDSIKYIVNQ